MTAGEVVITLFIAFASGGLGTLFWSRLNRIEGRLGRVEERLTRLEANVATKADVAALERLEANVATKADVAALERLEANVAALETNAADKAEVAALRVEFRSELKDLTQELREGFAGLRSDLTQVALAVGARRPRASEG